MKYVVFPICYLIGAIPFSYLIARFVTGKDIRELGSGNVGATNVIRTTGRAAGLFALLLDFFKGSLCVCIARYFLLGNETYMALAGFLAMLGHSYPVFLRFRGGKSVATGAGAFIVLSSNALLCSLAVFAAVVLLFRIISLGSIFGSASFPIFAWLFGAPAGVLLWGSAAAALIVLRHKSNVVRLLQGTERRLGAARHG
jgi:acyl phosphate:glycerol-3-phosphate acyltransferase